MDVITHAIVGAVTGSMFGRPIVGAIVAAAPDLVLGLKRKLAPTKLYDFTHAPIPMTWLMFVPIVALTGNKQLGACLVLCYLSHVVLDAFTHGDEWAPQFFDPFSQKRYSFGEDWEWFNKSWWAGLTIAAIWVIVCGAIAL